MARPQKQGLDYFSFDVDFFSDRKIKILKSRYGADGITLYIYLLTEIYRNGYYLKIDEDFEYIISDDLNMASEKVKQVMNFLLERSLFDDTLFQSDKVLTSAGIQKRFQLAVKERAKKNQIEITDFWLLSESETESFIKVNCFLNNSKNNSSYSEKNPSYSENNDTKESKEKKSKGKQRTVKKIEPVVYFTDEKLNERFIEYVNMRKNIKSAMTDRAINMAIDKLNELSTDNDMKIKILEQSIFYSWKGLFPLKSDKQQGKFENDMERWVSNG